MVDDGPACQLSIACVFVCAGARVGDSLRAYASLFVCLRPHRVGVRACVIVFRVCMCVCVCVCVSVYTCLYVLSADEKVLAWKIECRD